MRSFRITDRHPPKPWRRHKHYVAGELRWLAQKNKWIFRHHKKRIEIAQPDGRVVANFLQVEEAGPPPKRDERLAAFAALKQ